MLQEPLVECAYGWGKMFRLYYNSLEINGRRYALTDLEYVHPIYHRVLGVSSARLELHFNDKDVVLRGIAAVADVRKMVVYLNALCAGPQQTQPNIRWHDSDIVKPAQADRIATTNLLTASIRHTSGSLQRQSSGGISSYWSYSESGDASPQHRLLLREYSPITQKDASLRDHAQALTQPMEVPHWARLRQEQRLRRQRRLQAERSLREHGFDIEKLTLHLQELTLPSIPVPIRLAPGECAHYSIEASLCGEPVGGLTRYTYPAKDYGTLILTNKRMIYIGRKQQIILDYARLARTIRLRGAVAFLAEHWPKREIFEMRRPLECTMYLETILQRLRQQQCMHIEHIQPYMSTIRQVQATRERAQKTTPIINIDTIPLSQRSWHTNTAAQPGMDRRSDNKVEERL